MHKLAIFVEGYTEIAFLRKLIDEVAGSNNVIVEHRRIIGGSSVPRRSEVISAARPASGERYFVLLVDCGGDKLVKTRLLEEHQNLDANGYWKIIGLRDVRPDFNHAEIPRLELGLRTYIRTSLIPVEFVLSVMEIEAWFLAEPHHFPLIDPAIAATSIKAALGIDVENDDLSLRPTPQNDLDACYAIGGQHYDKQTIDRTINALDYENFYLEVQARIPYLSRLIACIEEFLSLSDSPD